MSALRVYSRAVDAADTNDAVPSELGIEISPRTGRPKRKRTGGRPPGHGSDIIRSDATRIDKFFKSLQLTASLELACAFAGISVKTACDWIRKGKEQSEGILHDFAGRCDQAMAAFEMYHIGVIHNAAGNGDAKASMWLLERRIPGRYMKREQHQLTDADGGPIVIKVQWPDGSRDDDESG